MRGWSHSYTLYISINLARALQVIRPRSSGRDPPLPGEEGAATLLGGRGGRRSRAQCRGGCGATARRERGDRQGRGQGAPAHHLAGTVLARLRRDAAFPEVAAQL